jgi:glycosyltransferase involved in cell wall biosynthesis
MRVNKFEKMIGSEPNNLNELTLAVGIPTYNNEATIRKTLESLINQTRKPDRIIVVDASTDQTPDILRKVATETNIPIDYSRQSDQGRGVGAARQEIYEQLEEDILACLDTKKQVDNDWVEQRVRFHTANPEYDILCGAMVSNNVDRPVRDVKDSFFLRQSNCSIRRSALDRVGGWDPSMARGEDWDLRIRLWRSGSQSYVKGTLSCEFIEKDTTRTKVTKIFKRPSSVNYIRKYGKWYAQFHPIHILGDVASIISIFMLLATGALIFVYVPGALVALTIPVIGAPTYLYFKTFRKRASISDFRLIHIVLMMRFFILGISALRELVYRPNETWNYGGLNSLENSES